MVTITLSAAGAKNAANRLREFLAADGINLKQTHAYEALAQALGYANWNTLHALLSATSSGTTEKGEAGTSIGKRTSRTAEELFVERLVEQAAPRTDIPFDPQKFDKFVGCYQFGPEEFLTVTRNEGQFLTRFTGQTDIEVYPESETKFFTPHVRPPAQISFSLNAQDHAESVTLHQHGREHLAKRVDASVVKTFEDALQKYVAANRPTAAREVLLRRLIAAHYAGTPNFEDMAPWIVEHTKQQWQTIRRSALRLGKLTKLEFLHVKRDGCDVYNAVFENGHCTYEVGALTPDHKLAHVWSSF